MSVSVAARRALLGGLLAWWAPAAAQEPVTPTPTLSSPDACPAAVRLAWNVTTIAGADGVRRRFLKGAPGAPVTAAELVESEDVPGATGSWDRDLRTYGPVLNGTRYFGRVRALQGTNAVATISPPALFEQSVAPDAQFSFRAVAGGSGGATNELRLDWSLTGPIGACADRIAWEVKRDGQFADPQAPDPAALHRGTVGGTSGSLTIPVPAPGEYYARLVARHRGDTSDDDVGRWATAKLVSIPRSVTLRVEVEDVVFSACVGGAVTVPGATVRVTGTGFAETRQADAAGRATFTLSAGVTYQVTASSATCLAQATTPVAPAADTDLKLRLPDCHHPQADLQLTAANPWPGGIAGTPYTMTFTVRHTGLGGPSRRADLRVERGSVTSTASTGSTELARAGLGALCPSQSRTVTLVDPSPQFGSWVYRAALVQAQATSPFADADPSGNLITRNASFLAPAPTTADYSYLNVTSFRLQAGAAWVGVGVPVSLDVVSTGQTPREYRAGECGAVFDAASFQAYAANPAPRLAGFASAGPRIVCLQLRGASVTSAVVRDTVAVVVPPDLDLSVAQSANPVTAGQSQTYTVTVRNGGGLPASGVVVRSTISDQVEYRSAGVGAPFNTACSRSGTTVDCTVPVLSPGQSATVRVVTLVPATAQSGHDISFSARVDPDNAVPESNERNNLAAAIAGTLFGIAAIAPAPWPGATGEHHRLECPLGQIVTGVYGVEGLWLDNIGIICAGNRGPSVFPLSAAASFDSDCGPDDMVRVLLWNAALNDAFITHNGVDCPQSPVSPTYDPAKARGVQGTVVFKLVYKGYGMSPGTMRMEARCPDQAWPIALDAYVARAGFGQTGIGALGFVCAKLQ